MSRPEEPSHPEWSSAEILRSGDSSPPGRNRQESWAYWQDLWESEPVFQHHLQRVFDSLSEHERRQRNVESVDDLKNWLLHRYGTAHPFEQHPQTFPDSGLENDSDI
ncbi:MAG: hypothetical protein AB7R89_03455 [Dehalococcoidia bacterium]